MTTTYGKVKAYPFAGDSTAIVCTYVEDTYVWWGNVVRTSGKQISKCNIETGIFEVTVDQATANALKKDHVFVLEYDDKQYPSLAKNERLVTNFNGYPIAIKADAA
jgi:hypothetical protein